MPKKKGSKKGKKKDEAALLRRQQEEAAAREEQRQEQLLHSFGLNLFGPQPSRLRIHWRIPTGAQLPVPPLRLSGPCLTRPTPDLPALALAG